MASARWKEMVLAVDAQSQRIRSASTPADPWVERSQTYRKNPLRHGDLLVERLTSHITPEKTVLDIGAGGGRYALPVALKCKHLTAIEPSDAMADYFWLSARNANITNVEVIREPWDKANAPQVDIVISEHTIETVPDAAAFIQKANGHAREKMIVVMDVSSPDSISARIWQEVYGEARCRLPALNNLMGVLFELGIRNEIDIIPGRISKSWDTFDDAVREFAEALFITEGSLLARLKEVMDSQLEKKDGRLHTPVLPPQQIAIVSWKISEE